MKSKRLLATVASTLGLAFVAAAQTPTPQTPPSGQAPPKHAPGDTAKPADPTAQRPAPAKGMRLWNAEDVVGMKVVNTQGEELGKIEEIVIHPRGDVAYAVLSFGGTMGVGDKLFAIPWTVLQTHATEATRGDEKKLVLAVDKERLKNAPGFDKSKWPSMANPDWSKDIDAYYAADRKSTTGKPVEASARVAGSPIWKSSELKGSKVETPSGENLGDIKDVVVDANGRISYVAISVGGFLGMGDRLVAVPFEALKVTTEGDKKKITLATTKDRLKEAPEFKSGRENWAAMTDPVYVRRVYEFYSINPYWTSGDMGDGGRGPTGAGNPPAGGMKPEGTKPDKTDKPEKP